ncbi:MAG TPA: DUF5131 family protein [Allosphingosinicella sp.]|jgi:protein gp37
MGATGIEWTIGPNGEPGFTFNPWIGCTKILGKDEALSACANCYAEAASSKFGNPWGPHADRRPIAESTWEEPHVWDRRAGRRGQRFRVFSLSMGDWLDNHPSIQWVWRARHFRLMESTPNLDWLLLTKRPENMPRFVPPHWLEGGWPPNVWFGVTGEHQVRFDHVTSFLRNNPAPVRFVSVEPMMSPILLPRDAGTFIDWIINGGESGRLAAIRDTRDEWMIDLAGQCAFQGIPYFGKQLAQIRHRKLYKNFASFPEQIRVREHPTPRRLAA